MLTLMKYVLVYYVRGINNIFSPSYTARGRYEGNISALSVWGAEIARLLLEYIRTYSPIVRICERLCKWWN